MLSIRTQDRMALVPYESFIEVKCNTYKVANKGEIKDVKEYNDKLMRKLKYELNYGNDKILLDVLIDSASLNKMYKEQKKEVPKEKYNEWNIKSNGENNYINLGTYATKKRALEVLDEIELHTLGKILIPEDFETKYVDGKSYKDIIEYERIEVLPLVYQMPKE